MGVGRPAHPAWPDSKSPVKSQPFRARGQHRRTPRSMLTGLICLTVRQTRATAGRDTPAGSRAQQQCTQASQRLHHQPPDDSDPRPHDSTKAQQVRGHSWLAAVDVGHCLRCPRQARAGRGPRGTEEAAILVTYTSRPSLARHPAHLLTTDGQGCSHSKLSGRLILFCRTQCAAS